jgi:DNA-binding transcriptional regulator YiaG
MEDKKSETILELVKQYDAGWTGEIEPEGYKFTKETLKVRFLNTRLEKGDYHSRVLVYSEDISIDPIYVKRADISDDQKIEYDIRKPIEDTQLEEEKAEQIVSLIKHFRHALHRQALEGSQIHLVSLAEFVNKLPERKPPLVEGLINQAEIVMLYGPTGHGVTTLMLNMAAHVIFGRDFLGFKIPRPIPNVGYLHFEGWPLDMEVKAKRLAKEFPGLPDKLFYHREYSFKITDPDGEATLRNIILNRELELLFIDNLINYIGGINVNDPNEVTNFVMNRLSNVSGSTGCAIVFGWHTGQASVSKRTGELVHPQRPMASIEFAGHSDLTARYARHPTREDIHVFQCTEDDKRRASDKATFRIETGLNPLTELITFADTEQERIAPAISPEHIREIRKKRGESQEQFAKAVGISESSIKRWENGKAVPEDRFRRTLWELQMELEAKDIQ